MDSGEFPSTNRLINWVVTALPHRNNRNNAWRIEGEGAAKAIAAGDRRRAPAIKDRQRCCFEPFLAGNCRHAPCRRAIGARQKFGLGASLEVLSDET